VLQIAPEAVLIQEPFVCIVLHNFFFNDGKGNPLLEYTLSNLHFKRHCERLKLILG